MGEDCDGKCRDQFPGYLELVQKRKLVCGLARSGIRCFLGSGVLPPDAHCTLSLRYVAYMKTIFLFRASGLQTKALEHHHQARSDFSLNHL